MEFLKLGICILGVKRMKDKTQKQDYINRLETIIFSLASYLNELYEGTDDDCYKHHQIIFGITKQEYKNFFKGAKEWEN